MQKARGQRIECKIVLWSSHLSDRERVWAIAATCASQFGHSRAHSLMPANTSRTVRRMLLVHGARHTEDGTVAMKYWLRAIRQLTMGWYLAHMLHEARMQLLECNHGLNTAGMLHSQLCVNVCSCV